MGVELRHLRYFLAVAEELHFGRAAKRVHIVQPTLSAQIARLEEDLGVQLLDRTKRSVKLTEAGRVFLEEARRTLDQSERAAREARRAADGETGRLAVGLVGSATYSVLTEVLSLYHKRFPEVALALREMNTVDQVEALYDERIEVGFLHLPSGYENDDLEVKAFSREPLMAVLPRVHPLSSARRVPLETLAGEPFVIPSQKQEPGYYEQLVAVCERAGFAPKVVQEVSEMQVGLSLSAMGVGIGLLPAAVRSLKATGTVYRKLAEPVPEMELSVARRRGAMSPVVRTFFDVAEQVARRRIRP